jgi:hypothetical protein
MSVNFSLCLCNQLIFNKNFYRKFLCLRKCPPLQGLRGLIRRPPHLARLCSHQPSTGGLNSVKHPGWQAQQGFQELENAVDSDTGQPKRQGQEPHDGVKYQCQQGQRPAKQEEENPKQETDHGLKLHATLTIAGCLLMSGTKNMVAAQ